MTDSYLRDNYAASSPLGNKVEYASRYDPSILHFIPRASYRQTLDATGSQVANTGHDIWHCYELSWLNQSGKPEVRVAQISVPAESPNIVESKSLKLYLNSLNNHQFESQETLLSTIRQDLQAKLECDINISLCEVGEAALTFFANEVRERADTNSNVILLDELDVTCSKYQRDARLLKTTGRVVKKQTLVSHLLRSFCPVTNQPDWASIFISYDGAELEPMSVLQYIVSFREHQGFHEQCIEQIYLDLMTRGDFDKLSVAGQFTRRGGIDITPVRSTHVMQQLPSRINRQ